MLVGPQEVGGEREQSSSLNDKLGIAYNIAFTDEAGKQFYELTGKMGPDRLIIDTRSDFGELRKVFLSGYTFIEEAVMTEEFDRRINGDMVEARLVVMDLSTGVSVLGISRDLESEIEKEKKVQIVDEIIELGEIERGFTIRQSFDEMQRSRKAVGVKKEKIFNYGILHPNEMFRHSINGTDLFLTII